MKFDQELTNLILNTEQLSALIRKATEILGIFNETDDVDVIQQKLLDPENYLVLQQAAKVSHYLKEIGASGMMKFVDKNLKLSFMEQKLVAFQVMNFLYENNLDLFNVLSQPVDEDNAADVKFEVVYGYNNNINHDVLTYQFLFDDKSNSWQLRKFLPGNTHGKIIKKDEDFSYYVMYYMNILLTNTLPENLNPFIKKVLHRSLQSYTNSQRRSERKKYIKQIHKSHEENLASVAMEFGKNIKTRFPITGNIDILHFTYFDNAKKMPELMAELLLVDGIFELENNNFSLISYLASYHHSFGNIQDLLEKATIRKAMLEADVYDIHYLMDSGEGLQRFAKIYFEHASQKQLNELGYLLKKCVMALSRDDFLKYKNQGKIQLDYPQSSLDIEEIYNEYPDDFESILEDMLASGKLISDIPRNNAIRKHYVNLLFKHKGQWLSLIASNNDYLQYNPKADLLKLAMKTDSQKTMSILKSITSTDNKGNQYLPITMKAEEIRNMIQKSPADACVLLNYKNILDTLRNETYLIEPYGEIRNFDYLYDIVFHVPDNYGENLLRDGILFPEKDMPHFHYLSNIGMFCGKNPSGYISNIFERLYNKLKVATFMSAFEEGLQKNGKVDRLFLKAIFNIDLLALAKVLQQFPGIKHLELGLSLEKENQKNIIRFFDIMRKINPHLAYHIHVEVDSNKKPFIFLKDYLSATSNNIQSLTIIPDTLLQIKVQNSKKLKYRIYFDECIREICQNNHQLRQVSIQGFRKPIFFKSNKERYEFNQLPVYNTHLFDISLLDPFSEEKADTHTARFLERNRNIHALKIVSGELRHFQIVLELLPWLSIYGLSVELILNIFDRLKYEHVLPKNTPHYLSLIQAIEEKKRVAKMANENERFSGITNWIADINMMVKGKSVMAYYQHKPHKKNIDEIYKFLDIEDLQGKVVSAITDWFLKNKRPDLTKSLKDIIVCSNKIDATRGEVQSGFVMLKSSLPIILELNGVPSKGANRASMDFCHIINLLNYYQKAVMGLIRQLQREPYIAFQCHGPLNNFLPWDELSSKTFDGFEFLNVLEKYNPKEDIYKSANNILKNLYANVFADFDEDQKNLFKNIMLALNKYLKQKDLPQEKQCDKHKHIYKNKLFELIKPENIAIFKNSKPRLYQILWLQRERLAISISHCSVKLIVRHYGLFSIHHNEKKAADKDVIMEIRKQIDEQLGM